MTQVPTSLPALDNWALPFFLRMLCTRGTIWNLHGDDGSNAGRSAVSAPLASAWYAHSLKSSLALPAVGRGSVWMAVICRGKQCLHSVVMNASW